MTKAPARAGACSFQIYFEAKYPSAIPNIVMAPMTGKTNLSYT